MTTSSPPEPPGAAGSCSRFCSPRARSWPSRRTRPCARSRTASASPSGRSRAPSTGRPQGRLGRRRRRRDRPPARRQHRAPCRERAAREENARLDEIAARTTQLTALLQLRAGFDYKTAAAAVIARESSEFRRIVVARQGDRSRDLGRRRRRGGRWRAGRPRHRGRTGQRQGRAPDRQRVEGHRPARPNAATGEVVGQLGGVLIMRQIDASETVAVGRRGRDRRHRARRRGPLAVSEGPAHRPGRRRPARRQRRRPDRLTSNRRRNSTSSSSCWSSLDYEGGLPPIEQQPVDCGPGGRHAAGGRATVPLAVARSPSRARR